MILTLLTLWLFLALLVSAIACAGPNLSPK